MDNWKPSWFHLALFGAAALLIWAGDQFSLRAATDAGIVCFGALMAAAGGDASMRRVRMFLAGEMASGNVVDAYRMVLDVLWGLIFIGAGVLAMAVVLVGWIMHGSAGTLWSDILGSTTSIGLGLALVGVMLTLNGLIRALAGSGGRGPKWMGSLPQVFDRMVGALGVMLGLAVSALGVLILAAPGWVAATWRQLLSLVIPM